MYSVAVSKRFLFQFPENSVPYYVGLSKVLFECLYGMADGVPEGKSRESPFFFLLFLSQSKLKGSPRHKGALL